MSLIGAAKSNFKEEIDRLLRSGADINQKDSYGDTVLMNATMEGRIKIAERWNSWFGVMPI